MAAEIGNEPFGAAKKEPSPKNYVQVTPKKTPSVLGEIRERKTPSRLARLGFIKSENPADDAPLRSPVGAIRHASGLTIRNDKLPEAVKTAQQEEPTDPWHSFTQNELFARLSTAFNVSLPANHLECGLTTAQHESIFKVVGPNEITPPDKMHPLIKFLISLVSGFQLMMNVGAVLCFVVFGITNGTDTQTLALGVMLIVVAWLTSAFQTYEEGKAEDIMARLKELTGQDNVFVVRNGEMIKTSLQSLVPGDVVKVNSGEKVPADLRILSATDLKVNNSSLTGENVDVRLGPEAKADKLYEARNIARSGCNFTSGNGVGIVYATGDKTFFGKIAKATLQIDRPESLMSREIHRMITILSVFAVLLGIVFGILAGFHGFTWVESVAFAIGIIVANVPEGLLSQLVVTLSITAKQLEKKKVIVTSLDIIETLGAVTVICSDKTGTLTKNQMTAVHVVSDGDIYKAPLGMDASFPPLCQDFQSAELESTLPLLKCIALNSDAVFINRQDLSVTGKGDWNTVACWETKGDASESALIKLVQPYRDLLEWRAACPRITAIPFNSTNKWMISVNKPEEEGAPVQVFIKGAPERVLDLCTSANFMGKILPMSQCKNHFQDVFSTLASDGERVLAFASLDLPPDHYPPGFAFEADAEDGPNFPTTGFTFHGYVSLEDPPRDAVPWSVKKCQEAGIKVFMVTGDHPDTAVSIAKKIGLVTKKTEADFKKEGAAIPENYRPAIAVHGTILDSYEQGDWDKLFADHDEIVFARTQPTQKQEIVFQLLKLDHIVAMTGDGVNDAPALKAANVGVAMGSGTSVAKEAGQIVLQEDDFSSILEGVRSGRLVFDAMKKVIMYVLVSNTPEIIPFLLYVAAGIPLGIETIVILTIDLGTDILPAIAMAYEKEERSTMTKPPRSRDEHLVSLKMILVCYFSVGIMHTFASYFGFCYVFLDRGFSWSQFFGLGLDFRRSYSELGAARQQYFTEVCNNPSTYAVYQRYVPGGNCTTDFGVYRQETIALAQASFFIGIIWGQIAGIFIRKTFAESILYRRVPDSGEIEYEEKSEVVNPKTGEIEEHYNKVIKKWEDHTCFEKVSWTLNFSRLFANTFLLWTILFEILLMVLLVYCPGVNDVFMMKGPDAVYVFCHIWYIPLLILYDELRKLMVRTNPDGCVDWLTNKS